MCIDFSRYQFNEIDKSFLKDGMVCVCRTKNFDDPFESWDYAVFVMRGEQAEIVGLFKLPEMAFTFGNCLCD